MAVLQLMKETLESGDPTVRSWFLVQSCWTPFICSVLYMFFVKKFGPALMRNRQPFDLRLTMILYNFSIVLVYAGCLLTLLYYVLTTEAYKSVCTPITVVKGHYTYTCGTAAWLIYIIKYAEYVDTVFFVLRKKFHLITNLHVIHHATLPVISWIMIRTERSGFQLIPGCINAFVHVIMYTYYALAAMGPEVRKLLWWKTYLTLLQMAQFVVILLFMFVVIPISGCKTTTHGVYINIFFATLFLSLFYNFFIKTYKKTPLYVLQTAVNFVNGSSELHLQTGDYRKDS